MTYTVSLKIWPDGLYHSASHQECDGAGIETKGRFEMLGLAAPDFRTTPLALHPFLGKASRRSAYYCADDAPANYMQYDNDTVVSSAG